MSKLRVWWNPQVGACENFYIPVNSVEEGKRILDILAAYDAFQLENRVKPDYCNTGGLEMWDEENQEWYSWEMIEPEYFDNVDEYCESEYCKQRNELAAFSKEVFKQIHWDKINAMY